MHSSQKTRSAERIHPLCRPCGRRTETLADRRSKAIILSQIKAYVGRNTPLEDNAFYHALQGIDSTVQQALKEMSAPKAEQALNTAKHE